MYRVEFYEDANGHSEIWEFMEKLRIKSKSDKDARIQYRQISMYIQLLQENGTNLPGNISKYLGNEIWELHPGRNRVLYFFCENDTYVLLHCFRKRTQKTPRREIERAQREMKDYLLRREIDNNENMGRI